VTAFASAIGRPREAMQAAWAHIIFNVAGVSIWIFLIDPFADLVRAISPTSEALQALERAAADTPRQIANAHTVFNVANVLLFIWFTGPLARLVERLVPAAPVPKGVEPKFLDDFFLGQPALALDQVRRELVHLGGLVKSMIDRALNVAIDGTERDATALSRADDSVDILYEAIIRYLGKLSQKELVNPQPQFLHDFVGIANYLENIGDVIEKDLSAVIGKRIRQRVVISNATQTELRALAAEVSRGFGQALKAVESGRHEDALDVIESKKTVGALAEEATALIAERLVVDEPNRMENFQVETEMIEIYKRLNTLSRRIARLAVAARDADADADEDR
jgi:phosphate:Na+ symporter